MGTGRGALALVTADGAVPASPGSALLEEMLAGWRNQQLARRLTVRLVGERERLVRQLTAFTGCLPWQWTSAQAEEWLASGGWAHSTVRSYQGALALFLDYVCDPRYGWVSECEQRAGAVPVQVFHERNSPVHASEHEGRPERRPLTRDELQAFFDAADDHVDRASRSRRKGWLASFRDATLFKVIYGSRRRAVATVMPWTAEALAQYLAEVRPRSAGASGPALWLTERGGRISPRSVDDRFAAWRRAAGLPAELPVHLIEDGVDPLFVQQQVGHSRASTTATYTTVGQDARNRMLRSALARAFGEDNG